MKIGTLILFCCFCVIASATAQCDSDFDSTLKMKIYSYVDEMPQYPGGMDAVLLFILKNFNYPNQETLQGSFTLEFIVNTEGNVTNAAVRGKKSIELSPAENEMLKVVLKMPEWKPGKCSRKKVPVRMYLPIRF